MKLNKFKVLLATIISTISFNAIAELQIPKGTIQAVEESVSLSVPPTFMDTDDVMWWEKFSGLLYSSDAPKTITLRVQGVGGGVLYLNQVVSAIKYAQNHGTKITMEIIGPSYSAHAMLVCSADTVIMNPGSSLMFHNISEAEMKFFKLLEYSKQSNDPAMKPLRDSLMQGCIGKGIITKKEVELVNNGKDIIKVRQNGQWVTVINEDQEFGLGQIVLEIVFISLVFAGLVTLVLLGFIKLVRSIRG